MVKILTLDENDDNVKDEINVYLENEKEFKTFIVGMKAEKSLLDIDKDLLEIKLSSFDYCYEDLMYYLFVLKNENIITFEELALLTGIVNEVDEDEGLYHYSEKLSGLIDKVTESLKDTDLNNFFENYEQYIESPEQDYIYRRALFNLDIVVTD